MFCGNCGTQNPDTSNFCKKCGKQLIQQPTAYPPIIVPKSSNFQCPSCGAQITDLKSRYCPKCLQTLNRNLVEKEDPNKKSMDKPSINPGFIMSFKGQNGQIELFMDKLIIKRAGFFAVFNHGFTKGEKTIYLRQITGIQLKLAGLLVGYIQFTLPGGIESKRGVWDATNDENTVTFYPALNNTATQLKEKIEELVQKSRQNTNQTIQVSSADEIKKFKHLLDEGIITKDEFDRKKKELLGL